MIPNAAEIQATRKTMGLLWRRFLLFGLVFFSTGGALGCFAPKRLTVATVGSILADVGRASAKQTDPSLVREGMPAYLMLLDGLIEAYPKDRRLLLAGAEAYCSYAGAFPDPGNPEASGRLYLKGREYALQAMPRHREFLSVLLRPYDALEDYVGTFSRRDVAVLFWFTSCWAGWIGATIESVEAIADVPRVALLMERIIELDETYHYGGAHLFMGIYKSSKPEALGGRPKQARRHFERALEIGKGDYLMAYVYFAEHYARNTFQRDLFVSLLKKVIEAPADGVPELILINTLAKQKATELLNSVEEYF
jgi:hypothetical protein